MKNIKSPFLSISSIKDNNSSEAEASSKDKKSCFNKGNFGKGIFVQKKKESIKEEWKEKVFSIAILLTGCADDAELVAQEVMESLSEHNYSEQNYNIKKLEEKIHKLAYDASISRLFNQVKSKTKDLENTSNSLLEKQNYIN